MKGFSFARNCRSPKNGPLNAPTSKQKSFSEVEFRNNILKC